VLWQILQAESGGLEEGLPHHDDAGALAIVGFSPKFHGVRTVFS
jgi:hypothetical protein